MMKPLLKWAGGKQKLLPQILPHVPKDYDTYYEPFLGGGAMFFYLKPPKAVLSDINDELINFYSTIRDELPYFISEIKNYENTPDFFYRLRDLDRSLSFENLSKIKRAARFCFLNKTCFNGLHRVNKQGQFNTPYGKYKNPKIFNLQDMKNAFHLFNRPRNVRLECSGFDIVRSAQKGDFVYFDPPYVPVSSTANFTDYTKDGFGPNDQERLKEMCDKLNKRGVKFLLSNSKCDYILTLYKNYDKMSLTTRRYINSKGSNRGLIEELLIKNF